MADSIPDNQKALVIPRRLADFELTTVEVYKPRPGEILVHNHSVGLNPADWKIWNATAPGVIKYPKINGFEAAGVVAQLGEGVTSFAVGDAVFYAGSSRDVRYSTFQEYSVVPAEIAAKKPSNLTFDQAATIPLALTTSAVGLYGPKGEDGGAGLTPPWKPEGRGKYASRPIVIFGGSSALGQFGIQLAKLSGFSPIITTALPHNEALIKSLGATHLIDRYLTSSEIIAAVKGITLEPIKVAYDTIAFPDTQNTAYDLVSPGGHLVLSLETQTDPSKLTPDKTANKVWGSVHPAHHRAFGVELFAHLTKLVEAEDLKPLPIEYVPGSLTAIPQALNRLKNNEISGRKLIVRLAETGHA